uniref:long-chain-fatty-acid--CoA ligase n=1 Tax=Syphacia muris TaxID=451379 RepID=A0A0N5AK33_9BILA
MVLSFLATMKKGPVIRSTSEARAARQWTVEKLVPGESPLWIKIIIWVIRVWLFIYDYLNYIPYQILDPPEKKKERSKRIKASCWSYSCNLFLFSHKFFTAKSVKGPEGPWRNVEGMMKETYPGIDTVDKLFNYISSICPNKEMLGTREIIEIHEEKQEDGRIFERWEMGEYKWQTYADIQRRVGFLAAALRKVAGSNPKVIIFAETRADWLISALACMRANIVIVTAYATLGEAAIIKAINDTSANILITSAELLPKVKGSYRKCPTLETLVYFPVVNKNCTVDAESFRDQFKNVYTFEEFEKLCSQPIEVSSATTEDLALIMFTSGTTGDPKGVMISHGNIIAGIAGMSAGTKIIGNTDTIVCYLPLAHIFELLAELSCMMLRCRLGYSSALTLHDRAAKVMPGTHGDCYVLRPTVVCGVPTIWDRVFKAVREEIATQPRLMQELFKLYYERKRERYEEGYRSLFLDRLIFKRISGLLGGNMKILISGGATLNSETQRFLNICMCCHVIQGYGLTESTAAAAIADYEDLTTGTSGPPLRCSQFILREWEEGGYSPENNPPQGEVLIGGANVSKGYWKQPEKTAEHFVEIDNVRYFATGDIGEMREDGSLVIIDRKKDLVKLPHGDYIALAKIETALITSPLIDVICVYGSPLESYLVALVVPNEKNIVKLAKEVYHTFLPYSFCLYVIFVFYRKQLLSISCSDWKKLSKNPIIVEEYEKHIAAWCAKYNLLKREIPRKVYICDEYWTADTGLVTEAMKLRRLPIKKKYAAVIDWLYEKNGKKID